MVVFPSASSPGPGSGEWEGGGVVSQNHSATSHEVQSMHSLGLSGAGSGIQDPGDAVSVLRGKPRNDGRTSGLEASHGSPQGL